MRNALYPPIGCCSGPVGGKDNDRLTVLRPNCKTTIISTNIVSLTRRLTSVAAMFVVLFPIKSQPPTTHQKRTLGSQYLMASRLFVVVVALLAISTVGQKNHSTDGGGGGDEYKEVKDEKAPESKEAASESWAGWVQKKLAGGLGIKHDGSDSKETATEKKKQTDDEEQVSWAKEKGKEVYDKAKNKAGETVKAAKHKSHDHEVKDNVAAGGGDHLEEL